MTQRPPQRPTPPPLPDLSTYRPYAERQGGPPPPPIEQRFGPPPTAQRTAPIRRPAPPRRRRSGLRIAAWTIGGLVAATAAGVAALVAFAPVGMLRDQLIREVQVRTGRDLVIAGRTSLSIYPSLGVTMGSVSLSAPPGMAGPPFVKMRQLEVRAALWPLIGRRVEVERLVLTEPEFELRIDARGRQSWDFAGLGPAPTIMVAQAAGGQQQMPAELKDFLRNSSPPAAGAASGSGSATPAARARQASIPDVALGDVRIVNGTVRYRDERNGLSEEVRAINARVAARSLAAPLETSGDLALRGDKVDFQARIGAPRALLEQRASRVSLTVASPKGSGRYEGSLSIAKGAELDGSVKLDVPSVRGLAAWIGAHLRPGPGLGAASLEGELKTGPSWVALNNAKASIDEITADGSANITLGAGRPSLKASLQLGTVDLNRYLADAGGASPPAPARGGDGLGPGTPALPRPAATGPQVKGFTQRSGWSDQPIDIAALGLLDAEVRLSLAGLVHKDVKVGATQGGLTLKNRVLKASIDDMRLYGGQGRATVSLEPSGQAAAVGVNLTLEGIAGLPLLKDAAGLDWLDGKGRIQLAVAGSGATERAIMETLNGKAEFAFTDGAIIGFNFPQIVRGLTQGRISGLARTPTERTDFSEAAASYQIRNGIAETKDLRATSPLLRLTGAGTVNLGQRQIDTVLRPRVVASLTGQGGSAGSDPSGLEVPVKIKGPWERPKIEPDLAGVLKNNAETFREIGRQLQQGRTEGLGNFLRQFKRN